MSSHIEAQAGSVSPLEKLMQTLQQEVAGKHQRRTDFEEAYPTLEQHLARKVPLKLVLAKFNAAYGYGLHPPAFRKMLEAERGRRTEAGTAVMCATCGHPLVSADSVEDAEGGV